MAVKVKATGVTGEYHVLVDGEVVGTVRKRAEIYSGIRSGNGRGGGTFYYWDATVPDGRRVVARAYRCTHCDGGEVHQLVGKTDGGYRLPECLSCGHRYSYSVDSQDRPEMIQGPLLTTEKGRDARLGATTRRDAVAALVEAVSR